MISRLVLAAITAASFILFSLSWAQVAEDRSVSVSAFERTVQMSFAGVDSPYDQANFNRITDEITALYSGFAQNYGGTLVAQKNWTSGVVNAFAQRIQNSWIISMYGGLYRHPVITEDSFALVTCHEIAHHFAGFPFKGAYWASAEGNSDYFAAVACLKKYFKSNAIELGKNLLFADLQTHGNYQNGNLPYLMCGRVYGYGPNDSAERGLCIRTLHAGREFAELNHILVNDTAPEYGNWMISYAPVAQTSQSHPLSQCRLNTLVSGALCKVDTSDTMTIPGHGAWATIDQKKGQRAASAVGCSRSYVDAGLPLHYRQEHFQEPWGYRPSCWFKPEPHRAVDF